MKVKGFIKSSLTTVLLVSSTTAFSSGFQLPFTSVSDLGNAFAGGAALANDATTNFANSAGDVRITHPQLDIGLTGVFASEKYSGSMFNPGFGSPTFETGDISTHPGGVLPDIHFVMPMSDKMAFGISLTSPYGLAADYPENSIARYNVYYEQAISEQVTPSIAFKLTDQLSFGLGPDVMYFKSAAKDKVRTEPLTVTDSQVDIEGLSDLEFGWHAGLLYQFTPATRVGLNFRSQVIQHLSGTTHFDVYNGVIPAGEYSANNTSLKLPLPPSTSLSIYHDFNERWSAMATTIYTRWSIYKQNYTQDLASPTGPVSTVIPTEYNDAWELHVAANYRVTDKLLLRLGASFIQGATNEDTRDLIFADNNSVSVACGAHYQIWPKLSGDIGYLHTFMKTAPINTTNPATFNTLDGDSKTSSDSLGLQVNWDFA